MKVGDLVKWTHPQYPSIGIIAKLLHNGDAYIYWIEDDDTDGIYPLDHKYLEIANEAG